MKPSNLLLKKSNRRLGDTNFRGGKVALDAMLEQLNAEDAGDRHNDPSYTTQNGKMMGKGTEVEQGALDDAIPGTLLASTEYRHPEQDDIVAEMMRKVPDPKPLSQREREVLNDMLRRRGALKCAACESGDCVAHVASEEFEVSRTASGKVVVADTKSYGAGTPNGGTPSSTPASPATPPAPTQPQAPGAPAPPAAAVNPVPPVSTVNKTPLQLSQDATQPTSSAPTPPGGGLTQEQLAQVLDAVKGASLEPREVSRLIAAIGLKPSPTMLPPRDDMRSHLDEEVKDEVKAGVTDPPPPAPAAPSAPNPQDQAQWQTPSQDMLLNRALASKSAATEQDEYIMLAKKIVADLTRLAQLAPQGEDIAALAAADTHDLQYFIDIDLNNTQPATKVGAQGDELGHLLDSITSPRGRGMSTDSHRSIVRAMRGQLMQVLREQGYDQTAARKKMKELISSHSKTAVQTESGVNQFCPSCSGQNLNKFDSDAEDGSLVECVDCGCFFAV
jgi:hypothetical protein